MTATSGKKEETSNSSRSNQPGKEGNSPTKKALLKHLYGESSFQHMLAVKHALDQEG